MKKLVVLTGCLALLTLAGQATYACSCMKIENVRVIKDANTPTPTPEEAAKWRREQTDHALFIGQVVKVDKVKIKQSDVRERVLMKKVTVRVNKYWLGERFIMREMIIYTGVGGGDCGVPYVKGDTYFFMAGRWNGLLQTNICGHHELTDKLLSDMNQLFGPAKEFSEIEERSRVAQPDSELVSATRIEPAGY